MANGNAYSLIFSVMLTILAVDAHSAAKPPRQAWCCVPSFLGLVSCQTMEDYSKARTIWQIRK